MADNVAITAGSGTTIATDDVGGVQYQRVKLAYGADGSATDVNTGSGLPVAVGGTAAVTQSGTWTVQPGNTANTTAWKVDGSAVTQPVSYTQKIGAYGTKTDVLTTELNSLGNGSSSSASAAYDNSTTRYPWVDVILSLALQGGARSAGATVSVFMTPRTDGTNYDDANATTAELVAVFPLDAATTARVRTVRRVSLPPENVKFFALNSTGQAFAASASVVSVRPYYDVSS